MSHSVFARAGRVVRAGVCVVLATAACAPAALAQPFPREVLLSRNEGRLVSRVDGHVAGGAVGASVTLLGDVNGDGIGDMAIGAPFTDSTSQWAGRVYVVYGTREARATLDLGSLTPATGIVIEGRAVPWGGAGSSVASADVNADGFADIVISAPDLGAPSTYGEVYVVFGGVTPPTGVLYLDELDVSRGFRVVALGAFGYLGRAAAKAGDVNGDGIDDLLLGNPSNGSAAGCVVVYGRRTPFPPVLDAATLDGTNGFRITSGIFSSLLGASVAGVGDVNGDGVDDFLVGAPNANPDLRWQAGSAYLVFGRRDGFPALLQASEVPGAFGLRFDGLHAEDHAGESVAGVGDVNHDGLNDFVIGAPYHDADSVIDSGAAYVVFGNAGAGWARNLDDLDGVNGFRVLGDVEIDRLGEAAASAGDLNGDGIDDLAIASARAGRPQLPFGVGKTFVIFGRDGSGGPVFGDRVGLSELDGRVGFTAVGVAGGDYTGTSLAGGGDVTGDGRDDLVIGAISARPGGLRDAGSVFVVHGRPACAADVNADAELTFEDVQLFVARFNARDARADFNSDGEWSFDDLQLFVALFNVGC